MEKEAPSSGKRRRSSKQHVPVDELSLDKCFEELEAIVETLERGNISLEESLRLFERGMALSRRCMKELEAIEQRIEMIVEGPRGEAQTVPFTNQEELENE
ncbi:MAG: exodeoxyribonuclease VII small subunit [Candidatus Sumerlaeaceae bacterium]|nr:exodeoxyribonuclease VII small subunit [Candidatus Sumerlaeaceae bacterium]